MSKRKTRKQKETAHHPFLVSWKPKQAHVKGKTNPGATNVNSELKQPKSADYWAQDGNIDPAKKHIVRSLIIISLVLILEVVVYLAWNEIMP